MESQDYSLMKQYYENIFLRCCLPDKALKFIVNLERTLCFKYRPIIKGKLNSEFIDISAIIDLTKLKLM